MSLTIRASRSDSPTITLEHPAPPGRAQRHVVALQRQGGAVDRRERRPQLVGDGRDEVALQLLDRALVGQVAESVHGALREPAAGSRARARGRGRVDRQRLRPRSPAARAASPPASIASTARPTISRLAGAGDRGGGRVPEPDDAVASTRKTPSPTNSSAWAACARRRSSPTSRALSRRRRRGGRAPARGRGRRRRTGPACREPSVITPSVSPRETNGTNIIELRADALEGGQVEPDLLERLDAPARAWKRAAPRPP